MYQIGKGRWSRGLWFSMVFASNCGWADALPKGWQARNLEPIGYVKLQGPRAFKLSIARRGERWYLFVGQGQGRRELGPARLRGHRCVGSGRPRVVTSVSLPAATGQISSHGNLLVVWRADPVLAVGAGIEHRISVQEHARAGTDTRNVLGCDRSASIRCACPNGGRAATGRTATSTPVARTRSCRRGSKVFAARASW